MALTEPLSFVGSLARKSLDERYDLSVQQHMTELLIPAVLVINLGLSALYGDFSHLSGHPGSDLVIS